MTYKHKLSRRLAQLPSGLLIVFVGACAGGEPTSPAGAGGDEPVAVRIAPRNITLETLQGVQFTGHGIDAQGDSVAEAIEWTASGGDITPDGRFSSRTTGTFRVVGRGRGRGRTKPDTGVVVVVPPQPELVAIEITPGSISVETGRQQTFTAQAVLSDSSRTALGVVWNATGGVIGPDGTYTAGTAPGAYVAIASNTSGSVVDTASISVTPSQTTTLAQVILVPATVTVLAGTTQQFTAYGRTSAGDSVATAATYTATGGSINAAGLYTAGSTPGTYRIVATHTGGTLSDTAQVVVVSSPTPAGTPGDTTWPTLSNVEVMDAIPATRVRRGLGFQVDPRQIWELQVARDIGASEVRFQLSWDGVERVPGQRGLAAEHAAGLDEAARLGLNVMAVAAYGPGWTTPVTFTVAANVGAGSTAIPVVETGSLSQVQPYRDHARRSDGNTLVAEGYWTYAGALIAGTQSGGLVLGAPLAVSLAAGQKINVNRRAYRPPQTDSPSDPSIAAYADYVQFLASEMSRRGVTGRVELWNEPPWGHDRWDGGGGCFLAGQPGCVPWSQGMAQRLLNTAPPAGIRWNWAALHKTGTASLFWGGAGVQPTRSQIESAISEESMHPYGGSPEWGMWNPHCLRTRTTDLYSACTWAGMNVNANHKIAYKKVLDHIKQYGWGITHTITEHGLLVADQSAKARYYLRSYFGYLGAGIERLIFYRLAGDYEWGIVDPASRAYHQAASALRSMIAEVDPLTAQAPDRLQERPAVTAYSGGQWPLMVVPVLGRKAGTSQNSYWMVVWQRTYPATGWASIGHPAGAAVTVRLPSGYRATGAIELTTRTPLSVSSGTGTATVSGVRDEPVAIRVEP